MRGDMDLNCGGIIVEEIYSNGPVKKKLFELIINTASITQTLSELKPYGDNEFNPWHFDTTE